MTINRYVVYVALVVLGLAGGLSLSARGSEPQSADARAIVDAIKDLTRETGRLRDAVTDASRDCRR